MLISLKKIGAAIILLHCAPCAFSSSANIDNKNIKQLSEKLYKITAQFQNNDLFFENQNDQALKVFYKACNLSTEQMSEFIILYMKKCKYDSGYSQNGFQNYIHDKCMFYIYILNRCYFDVPEYIDINNRNAQEIGLWILYRDISDKNNKVYALWPLKIDEKGDFHIVKMPMTINAIATGPRYDPLQDFDYLRKNFQLRKSNSEN